VGLGEDNEYVYKEIMGVSDEEYAELESKGHIGTDYAPGVP
jgi:benzylsuccinate CoA-transferase BbsF subunit/naphthyl-2-methylsuccinate CoA transferase subunit